ncbi:hypothetical protein ACFE04_016175 [Oxalis oulophora]
MRFVQLERSFNNDSKLRTPNYKVRLNIKDLPPSILIFPTTFFTFEGHTCSVLLVAAVQTSTGYANALRRIKHSSLRNSGASGQPLAHAHIDISGCMPMLPEFARQIDYCSNELEKLEENQPKEIKYSLE